MGTSIGWILGGKEEGEWCMKGVEEESEMEGTGDWRRGARVRMIEGDIIYIYIYEEHRQK